MTVQDQAEDPRRGPIRTCPWPPTVPEAVLAAR
jgi:hypothetical protein